MHMNITCNIYMHKKKFFYKVNYIQNKKVTHNIFISIKYIVKNIYIIYICVYVCVCI